MERRGLAHVEPADIIALFRIVDENKFVVDARVENMRANTTLLSFKEMFAHLSISSVRTATATHDVHDSDDE